MLNKRMNVSILVFIMLIIFTACNSKETKEVKSTGDTTVVKSDTATVIDTTAVSRPRVPGN